jgi:hypothetical protein
MILKMGTKKYLNDFLVSFIEIPEYKNKTRNKVLD